MDMMVMEHCLVLFFDVFQDIGDNDDDTTLAGNKAEYTAVRSDIIMTCGHFRPQVIGPFLAEHCEHCEVCTRRCFAPMCFDGTTSEKSDTADGAK